MANRLEAGLAKLAGLSAVEVRAEWERAHGAPAPRLAPDLLRLVLAYRLQERALGGLARASKAALRSTGRPTAPPLKLGTRLLRSWHGRDVAVLVDADGYLFEDRRYASLSAIAREVTGAAWSGPRFFGLHGKAANGPA